MPVLFKRFELHCAKSQPSFPNNVASIPSFMNIAELVMHGYGVQTAR